jgi:hypothetical protein
MRTSRYTSGLITIVATLALLLCTTASQAQTVQVSFNAKVVFVSASGAPGGVSAGLGDIVPVSLSYDLSSVDTDPAVDVGVYPQVIPNGIWMNIGGKLVTATSYPLEIRDWNGNEALEGIADGTLSVDGIPNAVLRGGVEFRSAGDILGSDDLPNPIPGFADWLAGDGWISAFLQDTDTGQLIRYDFFEETVAVDVVSWGLLKSTYRE